MKKYLKTAVFVLSFSAMTYFIENVFAEEAKSAIENYKSAQKGKRAYDKLLYARENIQQSTDREVINEAVQDLVKYSVNPNDEQVALDLITSSVDRLPKESDEFQEVVLAKGKIMTRLGQKEEAKQLFHEAIDQRWKHAMWRYSESLIDSGNLDEACCLEWKRISGVEPYVQYRGEKESLEIFLTLLRMMKHDKPEMPARNSVYQNIQSIKDIPDNSIFNKIAQALCMAEDGITQESILLLDDVDKELANNSKHREYKHIPLYKASILLKSRNAPSSQAAFTEFMNRNQNENRIIMASALRLMRDLEIGNKFMPIVDFATYIINSQWFKDENVKKELSRDDVASVYDMQQMGLTGHGKFYDSFKICKFVMDEYPGTLAAANCSQTYAYYLLRHDGDPKEAMELYNKILKETQDERLVAIVHYTLASFSYRNKEYDSALQHIQESLDLLPPQGKGAMANLRKNCLQLQDLVIKNKATN